MSHEATLSVMRECNVLGLVSECEIAAAEKLVAPEGPYSKLLDASESLHVHLKVDDTADLPREDFKRLGGEVEFEKQGFVKFRFPGGARLIFSSIPVAQDELGENALAKRSRPFVDHFGVDLRDESDASRRLFDDAPVRARELGWGHVPQGGNGAGVHCCHTEVQAKHWVYPSKDWDALSIPIEIAFGELVVNADASGCDLRPMNPAIAAELGANAPTCCGE